MKKIDIWWKAIVALLCIAWLPLFAAEVLRNLNTGYEVVGFGLAWGLTVMPLCTLIAGILLVFKIVDFIRAKDKPQ